MVIMVEEEATEDEGTMEAATVITVVDLVAAVMMEGTEVMVEVKPFIICRKTSYSGASQKSPMCLTSHEQPSTLRLPSLLKPVELRKEMDSNTRLKSQSKSKPTKNKNSNRAKQQLAKHICSALPGLT